MATSIVRVYNSKQGKWAYYAKVVLAFDASFGGQSPTVYTNDNGEAIIQHASTGQATVYIDGKNRGRMQTPGSQVFNI
jgi:hypothetical protein